MEGLRETDDAPTVLMCSNALDLVILEGRKGAG